MTQADDRLAALFAADLPPARDPVFQAQVLERVARRRFQDEFVMLSGLCGLGAVLLWAIWPVVAPAIEAVSRSLAPGLIWLVVAASILALTSGRALAPRS
jgi:hypothetical protein